jgi:hypothetical protein
MSTTGIKTPAQAPLDSPASHSDATIHAFLPINREELRDRISLSLLCHTLEAGDGANLADEISDDFVKALQRAFPKSRRLDWEEILADARGKLVERLSEYLDGLVKAKDAVYGIAADLVGDDDADRTREARDGGPRS